MFKETILYCLKKQKVGEREGGRGDRERTSGRG